LDIDRHPYILTYQTVKPTDNPTDTGIKKGELTKLNSSMTNGIMALAAPLTTNEKGNCYE
jgi:hypothetical protein